MFDLDTKIPIKMAWGYSSPRRESEPLALVYGDMTIGGDGGLWEAPCLDTTGFVYGLAGHALLSEAAGNSVTLYDKDGEVISSGDYTLDLSNDYQGQGSIAIATFTADAKDSEPITVRAKGRTDAAGELIENPVGIIEDLLLNLAGMPADEISSSDFSRAWFRAEELGFVAAGALLSEKEASRVITGILGCFLGSWWRGADGKLKVFMDLGSGSLSEAELALSLEGSHLKQVSVSASLSDLVNRADALYCHHPMENEYQARLEPEEGRDYRSQALYGEQLRELELNWVREAATARAICARLVGLLAAPRRLISCTEDALISLPLEKGDAALFSLDWLLDELGRPLVNQIVRVLSLEPQLDAGTIRFSLMDTGYFKTVAYLADGTYVAGGSILAGGERDLTTY